MSFNSDDYDNMFEEMNKLFPNAPFSYDAEHFNCLDDVLIEEPYALIYHHRTCYCVGDKDPTPISIVINSYNGKNITYRNFYAEIEKKWDKDYEVCNHHFLEFISIKNNIIELEFGS